MKSADKVKVKLLRDLANNVSGEGNDRELSFIKGLILGIKNSNISDADKAKLYQRIKNFISVYNNNWVL